VEIFDDSFVGEDFSISIRHTKIRIKTYLPNGHNLIIIKIQAINQLQINMKDPDNPFWSNIFNNSLVLGLTFNWNISIIIPAK
jgi:hypothetical protein